MNPNGSAHGPFNGPINGQMNTNSNIQRHNPPQMHPNHPNHPNNQQGQRNNQGPHASTSQINHQNQSRLPPPAPREANKMAGVAQFFSSAKPFGAIAYTEDEYVDIQSSLDKTLGPEYVSSRPGAGGSSVAYLEGWKALNIANEIFGFNGWNSELVGYTLDFCDTSRDGRVSMGLSVVVRVTIKDGTYHEDIGYGYIDNAKNKAAAYEKCKKEALTDGVKRCLRCFGNVLGNCLYDKTLTSKLKGIPKQQTAMGADDFYRDDTMLRLREERQNNKVNIMEVEPELSEQAAPVQTAPAIRNSAPEKKQETEKPVPTVPTPIKPVPTDLKTPATKSKPVTPSQDEFDDSFLFSDDVDMHKIDDYEMEMIMNKSNKENEDPEKKEKEQTKEQAKEQKETPEAVRESTSTETATASSGVATETTPATTTPAAHPTVSAPTVSGSTVSTSATVASAPVATPVSLPLFVSAKKADLLKSTPNASIPEFDPKFVSPNVRRTLDPSKSVPVKRSEAKPLQNDPSSQTPSKPKRMIGMPPVTRQAKRIHKE